MLRSDEVESFLEGKLSMKKNSNRRHDHYSIHKDSTDFIPILIAVSLGEANRKLPEADIVGISECMGMSREDLKTAINCNIGPSVCILGMALALIQKAKVEIDNDPITSNWDSLLLLTIPDLIQTAKDQIEIKRGSSEPAFLEKVDRSLSRLYKDSQGAFRIRVEETLEMTKELMASK